MDPVQGGVRFSISQHQDYQCTVLWGRTKSFRKNAYIIFRGDPRTLVVVRLIDGNLFAFDMSNFVGGGLRPCWKRVAPVIAWARRFIAGGDVSGEYLFRRLTIRPDCDFTFFALVLR